MSSKVDQKEYLKKYLSGKKKDHKRKKKREHSSKYERVRIIDDDVDVRKKHSDDDLDFILTGEDAPQIVGVIDERPQALRTSDDYKRSGKWKTLSSNSTAYSESDNHHGDRMGYRSRNKVKESGHFNSNNKYESPRKKIADVASKGKWKNDSSEDLSPQRKHGYSPDRKRGPRLSKDEPDSKKRRESDKLRMHRKPSDDDLSPSRKRRYSTERRPQTKQSFDDVRSSEYQKRRYDDYSKRPIRGMSPSDRKVSKGKKVSEDDDDDLSPLRRRHSPKRDNNTIRSETFKTVTKEHHRRSSSSPLIYSKSPTKEDKCEQTLDGKKAGLQKAETMKKEIESLRQKDNEEFQKMSADLTGKDAEAVVRSRDRNRRFVSPTKLKEQEENQKVRERAYTRWGKGLKQIDDYETRIREDTNEMSKPLARYSDDKDLEELLKNQERMGDPMLEYIRQKNNEKTCKNEPVIPIYKGSFPENRFNVRPGYRWDGVDRSNGYEKKWFDVQNKKKAMQEDAYRYSTEDM